MSSTLTSTRSAKTNRPFYKGLFFQVIVALFLGIAMGCVAPASAIACKPLGDAFIKLIKMLIAPIIFCTMVSGIAGMGNMKQVGRVGAKALLVFEIITFLALIIGWVLVEVYHPGSTLHIDTVRPDVGAIHDKVAHVANNDHAASDFFINMIPSTFVSAFSEGEILQVLVVAILFALALSALDSKGREVLAMIDSFSHVLFKMVDIITLAAPIGAFGAMAYTVGKFGVGSLKELG